MRIRHVPLHVDLAFFVAQGLKRMTFRPMKPQPALVEGERILFSHGEGSETSVWLEDYPCPYGDPGEMIIFYFEGNGQSFYECKVTDRRIKRLNDITDEEVKREGWETREQFFDFWDQLYGESEHAAVFNPYVWAVSFN